MTGSGKPRITVITPTYNRGGFLGETIRSVLTQGVPLEYIVIDDGSTDNTKARIWYLRPFLRYISQPNAGEVRTVNRGLGMVKTEFFAVVNSDDPLLPGSLKRMIAALDANPTALGAYCDWRMIDAKGRFMDDVRVGPYDLDSMLVSVNLSIGPGAVFRTRCLEEVGLRNPELRYSADLDYWLRIGLAGGICYAPGVFATHRTHPGAASSQGGSKIAAEVANLFKVYADHPKRIGGPPRTRVLATGHFAAALACGDVRNMQRNLILSIAWHPEQFVTHFERVGAKRVADALKDLGVSGTGRGAGIVDKAFAATTRRRAFRLLAHAIRVDPAGAVAAAGERVPGRGLVELALRWAE